VAGAPARFRRLNGVWRAGAMLVLGAALIGCATPLIRNSPSAHAGPKLHGTNRGSPEIFLALAFSGGGARASALAYGVLEELAATEVHLAGEGRRLFDEIDVVSSVSGGSFTAAYLGLHGDGILEGFRSDVLYRDMTQGLWRTLFNPANWRMERGDMAAGYYDEAIFHGATFGDFRKDGPHIVINATDLVSGTHFLFLPEYFAALCSDIDDYPVAWAVTASSAVPGAFNPIVLENHSAQCSRPAPAWIGRSLAENPADSLEGETARNLASYYAGAPRNYIHLVDGGIAGNLGVGVPLLREAEYGGRASMWRALEIAKAREVLLVVVDAATSIPSERDQKADPPSSLQLLSDTSTLMVNRTSRLSMALVRSTLEQLERELPPSRRGRVHIAELDFGDVQGSDERAYFEAVPTSLAIEKEQVDRLVAVGRELLRGNAGYRDFISRFGSSR